MSSISDIQNITYSNLNHIDALLDNGPNWNLLLPYTNTIQYTFSITTGNESGKSGQVEFSAAQKNFARSAMAYVSTLTGIQFAETSDGSAADVHLCAIDIAATNIIGLCQWNYSYSYYEGGELASYEAGAYVYLDSNEYKAITDDLTPGLFGYEVLLHELGHMLGLKHPFDASPTLPSGEDSTVNTLMSYTHSGGYHSTFMPYDVAALNWIYGGDGLAGALGVASSTGARYYTGTSAANVLTGTGNNDKLQGGGGNDSLDGGAGNDTAVYAGARAAYTVVRTTTGFTVSGNGEGTDTLSNIELLQFSDATLRPMGPNRDQSGDGKSDIVLFNSNSSQLYLYQMNGAAINAQGAISTLPAGWSVVGQGDANGDGKSDLLLRNNSTGQIYSYFLNGNVLIGQGAVATQPNYQVVANADFNGDGKADILLRNSAGQLYMYMMNGATISSQGVVDTLAAWTVAATGDYNGDGKADLLLRNTTTGQLYQYRMNGTAIIGQGLVDTLPAWGVAASGDYNGDGNSDILLRNSTTGQVWTYLMLGNVIIGQGGVDTLASAWKIADGAGDYNGDGKSDILLRNDSGQLYEYLMNGTAITSQGVVSNPGAAWNLAEAPATAATVKAANDFNGDGKSDILLRNPTTGQLYEYRMNGTTIAGQGSVDTLPGWLAVATGDYNGDGKADILLRNNSSGQLYTYLMNGNTVIGQGSVDTLPGWQVAGGGDFNGDGKSDILLRNIASGQLYEYMMNGSAISAQGLVDTLPAWQVAGTGDFNGDSKTDILLRNPANGQLYEYLMNGAAIIGQGLVDNLPGWQVAGTGDYNGDGKSDILLRNPTTGQLYQYRMNGASIASQGLVDTLPTSWQVADGNSDFNGDGKADLLLRNTYTGQLYEYLLNGNTIIGQGTVDTLPGWNVAQERKVFTFDTVPGSPVTLSGFASGFDKIILKKSAFTALTNGALPTASLVTEAGAVAHDTNDYLLYDSSNGKLYYDADGNGAGAAIQIATLLGQPPVIASDITGL